MRRSPKPKSQASVAYDGKIRVAGYVRCSDEGQSVSDYNTLDNQQNLIAQHIAMHVSMGEPWELAGYYVDDGFSGKNIDRPNLSRLLQDIRAGEIQAVVVYKLDRITRSLADFFHIDRLMAERNCALVSVKEQLDTSKAMGRLMRNMLLSFAEMEREVNSERVRDKMHAEALLGRHLGGSTPYGYDVVEKKLVPNADEAKVVRVIFDKYAETRSLWRVRDYVNGLGYRTRVRPYKNGITGGKTWTIQTIEKMLQNQKYKGSYTFDNIVLPEAHEGLVLPELFDLCQTVKAMRHRPSKPKDRNQIGHTYLLQGLTECHDCGTRMTPFHVSHRTGHKRPFTPYYECGRSHKNPAGDKCAVSRYNADYLEWSVLGMLDTFIQNPAVLQHALDSADITEEDAASIDRLTEIQDALRSVRSQIENIVQAVAMGTGLTSLSTRLAELERQERELHAEAVRLETARGKEKKPLSVDEVRAWLEDIVDLLKFATPEQKKTLVGGFVRKVVSIDKQKVQVTYNVLPALPAHEISSCLNLTWLPGVDSNHEPDG